MEKVEQLDVRLQKESQADFILLCDRKENLLQKQGFDLDKPAEKVLYERCLTILRQGNISVIDTKEDKLYGYLDPIRSFLTWELCYENIRVARLFLGYRGTQFANTRKRTEENVRLSLQDLLQAIAKVSYDALQTSEEGSSESRYKWRIANGYSFVFKTGQNEPEPLTILGTDQKMLSLFSQIENAPEKDALIIGATGVGKELVAKAAYSKSLKYNQYFAPINSANLRPDQVQPFLYGSEKGSFTHVLTKAGIGELYDGGTIFFDEIHALPLESQAMLLRFWENKEFYAVGGQKLRKIDVRLICATNHSLDKMVTEGTFRRDFLERLRNQVIHVPNLIERHGIDRHLLADFFLQRENTQQKTDIDLEKDAMEYIESFNYAWPGNVRELSHTLERAMEKAKVAKRRTISLAKFREEILGGETSPSLFPFPWKKEEDLLREFYRQAYRWMQENGKTLSAVAEEIGVNRQTVTNKFKEYGLLTQEKAS